MKPSIEEVNEHVQAIAELVAFFPQSAIAQRVIAGEIRNFCADNKQLEWFTETYVRSVLRYESPAQLRAVFCSRYRPDDGKYPTVDVQGFTSNDLEAKYLAREAEETDRKLLEWRREAQQGLLTGEIADPIQGANPIEPANDVERLLPAMADAMAFPGPKANGPLTLEDITNARLAYLNNPDELKKQWRKRESEELQAQVRQVFPDALRPRADVKRKSATPMLIEMLKRHTLTWREAFGTPGGLVLRAMSWFIKPRMPQG